MSILLGHIVPWGRNAQSSHRSHNSPGQKGWLFQCLTFSSPTGNKMCGSPPSTDHIFLNAGQCDRASNTAKCKR